jgi:hypothetical protein
MERKLTQCHDSCFNYDLLSNPWHKSNLELYNRLYEKLVLEIKFSIFYIFSKYLFSKFFPGELANDKC